MVELVLDTYLNLCTQVYDLSKPTPPQDAYEFYRSYATSANGRILEPMCGTGRFLLPLVAEGFDAHGFDGSQHMLDALQMKAKAQNLKVNVWQGLVEDLKIQKKYSFIFIPSGSIGLITDIQAAKNALKKFYDLLIDGGALVFEAETLKAAPTQPGVWRGSMYPREDGTFILANFLELPMKNNVSSTIGRYELVDSNAIIKTEIETLKVRLYEPESLRDMLTEVGFTAIKKIKAFDCEKQPDIDDEVVIYECRK
jgi:ubiquinone/menaquinone biosynthesis C-methylase UbiE